MLPQSTDALSCHTLSLLCKASLRTRVLLRCYALRSHSDKSNPGMLHGECLRFPGEHQTVHEREMSEVIPAARGHVTCSGCKSLPATSAQALEWRSAVLEAHRLPTASVSACESGVPCRARQHTLSFTLVLCPSSKYVSITASSGQMPLLHLARPITLPRACLHLQVLASSGGRACHQQKCVQSRKSCETLCSQE